LIAAPSLASNVYIGSDVPCRGIVSGGVPLDHKSIQWPTATTPLSNRVIGMESRTFVIIGMTWRFCGGVWMESSGASRGCTYKWMHSRPWLLINNPTLVACRNGIHTWCVNGVLERVYIWIYTFEYRHQIHTVHWIYTSNIDIKYRNWTHTSDTHINLVRIWSKGAAGLEDTNIPYHKRHSFTSGQSNSQSTRLLSERSSSGLSESKITLYTRTTHRSSGALLDSTP